MWHRRYLPNYFHHSSLAWTGHTRASKGLNRFLARTKACSGYILPGILILFFRENNMACNIQSTSRRSRLVLYNSKWAPVSIFYLSVLSAFHRLNYRWFSYNLVLNRMLQYREKLLFVPRTDMLSAYDFAKKGTRRSIYFAKSEK